MNIKLRLTLLSFFQFFVWGAWLITLATYYFTNNIGTGVQLGAIFSTLALLELLLING
jgi:NHS family xanthosine MFS transporter